MSHSFSALEEQALDSEDEEVYPEDDLELEVMPSDSESDPPQQTTRSWKFAARTVSRGLFSNNPYWIPIVYLCALTIVLLVWSAQGWSDTCQESADSDDTDQVYYSALGTNDGRKNYGSDSSPSPDSDSEETEPDDSCQDHSMWILLWIFLPCLLYCLLYALCMVVISRRKKRLVWPFISKSKVPSSMGVALLVFLVWLPTILVAILVIPNFGVAAAMSLLLFGLLMLLVVCVLESIRYMLRKETDLLEVQTVVADPQVFVIGDDGDEEEEKSLEVPAVPHRQAPIPPTQDRELTQSPQMSQLYTDA